MADLREKIDAEIENIEHVLSELPASSKCPCLSTLELAGVAALIHSFYNGIENILKQILCSFDITIPQGPSWHRDLINVVLEKGIINVGTAQKLQRYLAFRHFFTHAYAFDLYADRMVALIDNAENVLREFKQDIEKYRK